MSRPAIKKGSSNVPNAQTAGKRRSACEGGTADTSAHVVCDRSRERACPNDLGRMQRNGLLVGWRDGKQIRFPVWQFVNGGLLPGMRPVLEELRQTSQNDDWARMLFFLSSRGSLEEDVRLTSFVVVRSSRR
jgi:hypothetical protein